MKKIFFSLLSLAAITAHAQTDIIESHNVKADVITEQGDRFNVSADKMSFDNTARTIEYSGVDLLTTDLVEICDAEKIVYNIDTNELILTGNLIMTGVAMQSEMPYKGKSRHIRYKIGDTVAYIE
jgi:lipopolysaccharide export system protein LptA